MSVRVIYHPNRSGINRCALGPELRHAVHHIVETRAAPFAKAISPHESGEYADSWEVIDGTAWIGKRYPYLRVSTILINNSDHATLVEVGNDYHDGHWVLAKTLDRLEGII